jgi:hypothetical protein
MAANDDSQNPPMKVGVPVRPSSLAELKAWAALNGFLGSVLIETGYYFGREAPGDREMERRKKSQERDR